MEIRSLEEIEKKEEELRKKMKSTRNYRDRQLIANKLEGICIVRDILASPSYKNKEYSIKYRIKEVEDQIKDWEEYTGEKAENLRAELSGLKYAFKKRRK